MRTIKFRGYNKKTRSWIHGFYFMNRGEHFIAPDGMQSPDRTWEDFLVVPESIGQFTGIKDKNGVEIYEGDFLRSDAYPYSIVEEGKLDNYYAEVYWQDNECGFYVVKVKNEKSTVVGIDHGMAYEIGTMPECEVFSNAFEHPELSIDYQEETKCDESKDN